MLNTLTDFSFGALTDELLDQEIQTPENVTVNLSFELPLSAQRTAAVATKALEETGYSSSFMQNRKYMFSDYVSCDGRPEYIVMSLEALTQSRTVISLSAGFTESSPECNLRLEYMAGLIRLSALD